MKILITGGNGFIGSYVTKALLKRGEDVAIYSTFKNKSIDLEDDQHLTFIRGNIINAESLINAVCDYHPDVILHLAAITGIKRCLEKSYESFVTNVYGTFNVVLAARKINAKLIFASSREVYGETKGEKSSEDASPCPNNLYGLTKQLGEEIIKWGGKKHGLDFTILRISNIYGPGGDKYNVQAMILKALKEERIEILGGDQIMNLIHVEDVAESILTSIFNKKSSREVFNVGSENITVRELVRRIVQILEEFGREVKIKEMQYRPSETIYFKPDISKIVKVLGWKPQISLDTGLYRTIKHYLKS